jgi:hypothetical protein
MAISSKAILKAIDCDKLELVRVPGDGYWYFAFDDIKTNNVYDTKSIYVMRLNDMSLENWVEYGADFVTEMNEKIAEKDLTGLTRFRIV